LAGNEAFRFAICFFIFVQMTQSRIRREAFAAILPGERTEGITHRFLA
jgi:hypothetical protein